jgi:hypothetical protein
MTTHSRCTKRALRRDPRIMDDCLWQVRQVPHGSAAVAQSERYCPWLRRGEVQQSDVINHDHDGSTHGSRLRGGRICSGS